LCFIYFQERCLRFDTFFCLVWNMLYQGDDFKMLKSME
jgi:hypothetical protein